MPQEIRMGLGFNAEDAARLRKVCDDNRVSYSRLIVCVLALSDEEIKGIIDRTNSKVKEESKQRKELQKQVTKSLAKLTTEQLAALMKTAGVEDGNHNK